jgi:uncharacterized protein YdhG (YjbR/CyaY superfamily)
MKTKPTAPQNIDEYIARFPNNVQEILEKIRMTIRKAAPDAEEAISYKMPSFNWKGQYLIYFAAYKKHIGVYPVPTGDAKLNEEVSKYQAGKGTLQFPLDKPIPYKLISKIVKARAKQNSVRAAAQDKK